MKITPVSGETVVVVVDEKAHQERFLGGRNGEPAITKELDLFGDGERGLSHALSLKKKPAGIGEAFALALAGFVITSIT